jgi:hypothetical protein
MLQGGALSFFQYLKPLSRSDGNRVLRTRHGADDEMISLGFDGTLFVLFAPQEKKMSFNAYIYTLSITSNL